MRILFKYCRKLAPGIVSLAGDGARGDDSKQTPIIMLCDPD